MRCGPVLCPNEKYISFCLHEGKTNFKHDMQCPPQECTNCTRQKLKIISVGMCMHVYEGEKERERETLREPRQCYHLQLQRFKNQCLRKLWRCSQCTKRKSFLCNKKTFRIKPIILPPALNGGLHLMGQTHTPQHLHPNTHTQTDTRIH